MSISREELLRRLEYPPDWLGDKLYPEDLYLGQLDAFCAEANERGVAPEDYRPDGGTEHFRYGAFHYWFGRTPNAALLELLLEAAAADPDPPMAGAAIADIMRQPNATIVQLNRGVEIVSRSSEYYVTAPDLRSAFQRHE